MSRARRKFLFYTNSLSGGGAERVWALLASEFCRRGHSVVFAVDYEASHNRRFLAPGIRYVVLARGQIRSSIALFKLIRREKPDVTLSAMEPSNVKIVLATLLALRHRRTLISYHGFFGGERGFLSRLCNMVSPLTTRLCGRAVAVSQGLRHDIIHRHNGSPKRVGFIHNPVYYQSAPLAVSEADLRARVPRIVFVGRFSSDKDCVTLLRAFARVETPQAELLLVGEGPERRMIEAEIDALNLSDRVTLTGYLDNPSPAYNSARCLALSSRHEGFGNVIAEALGHGLAVVSTDAAGPSEILAHGQYGTLVPIGDAAALAQALDAALANPGDPAPRQARAAHFSVEYAGDAYMALCETIIAEAEGS